LAQSFQVILIDLRNHGNSPHSEIMNYHAMVEDLLELKTALGRTQVNLLGHSLGGKVAMHFSLEHPDKVRKLVVVDIAPKQYPPWHRDILDALLGLDLSRLRNRSEMERALEPAIPDLVVRRFLLANVRTDPNGHWHWRLGLQEINANYEELNGFPLPHRKFPGPALFIRGEKSDYIETGDLRQICEIFPQATIETVPAAGHWVHADALGEFTTLANKFLESSEGRP
jgi:esterase